MEITPHSHLVEALFAFKSKVSSVFNEVLGLHEINHIAISHIGPSNKILTFSSTPAMEFNLFNSKLWRFDKSYSPEWFKSCTQRDWQSLYAPERYDELYYLKQLKHHLPTGYTLAARSVDNYFIYSFASKHSCGQTEELFTHCYHDFYEIGQHCTNMLSSLFQYYGNLSSQISKIRVEYETSSGIAQPNC